MQKQPFLSSAQHGNSFPPVNGKSVAASYLPQLFLTVWGQVKTLSQRRRTTYLSAAWVHSSSQSSLGRRGELRAILPVPTLQGCSRAICCKVWERMGCFVVSMPLMFTGLGNRELRKGNCAQGTLSLDIHLSWPWSFSCVSVTQGHIPMTLSFQGCEENKLVQCIHSEIRYPLAWRIQ